MAKRTRQRTLKQQRTLESDLARDFKVEVTSSEVAHLSTNHINSKMRVLAYEMQVIDEDIEKLTAGLQGLERRRATIEAEVAGMQQAIAKR